MISYMMAVMVLMMKVGEEKETWARAGGRAV
jgi:hypothetical protein